LIFRLDAALREECERFAFRFCCDDCVHFDPKGEGRCAHGFPIGRHRAQLQQEDGAEVHFCKEFSLG
jgi:hypothetical protein